MKLLASVFVLWTLVAAISGANIEKRGNIGAAIGLGVNVVATTQTAKPTIPSFINTLTSQLFNRNVTTDMAPIYGLLKQLTSNIFPFISNATYGILKPFNPILNTLTSNLYNALCAPPNPQNPTWAPATSGPGMPAATTSAPAGSNPITSIINLITGNGGTSGTNPITQLIAALTGSAGTAVNSSSSLLNTILTALGNHFGNDASTIQSLLSTLGGLITGATGSSGSTGNSTSGSNPITSILNALGLGAISPMCGAGTGTGLGGLFPGVTVTGNVNVSLNLSPQALNTVLSSIGQTTQSLQAALNSLGWTAQQFVNGLSAFGGNVLAYLQSIFAKANPTTSTGTTSGSGGPFPGVAITGSVNGTLNLSPLAFNQLLASMSQTLQSLQAALTTLSGTAQQFVDGLSAYQGNASAYLQAIFAAAKQNTTSGATNTLQGLLNNLLNSLNNVLSGTGLLPLLSNLLAALGLQ